MYMTPAARETEERGRPIFVTKDSMTSWISANVTSQKGATPEGVKRLGEEIDKLGHHRLVFKSDQEPAIKALIQSVRREKH